MLKVMMRLALAAILFPGLCVYGYSCTHHAI